MNIDEAIRVLELMGIDIKYWKDNEGENAIDLGIAALQGWKRSREAGGILQGYLLPGETEK